MSLPPVGVAQLWIVRRRSHQAGMGYCFPLYRQAPVVLALEPGKLTKRPHLRPDRICPASDKVPVHKLSHLEHRDDLLAVEYRQ